MAFSAFSDIEAHLAQLGMFHMDLRLDRVERVLAALKPARSACRIQVVGTNGKGSTSTFLATLAATAGLNVGLFTSPHLANVRERIRLYSPGDRGRLVSEEGWLDPASKVMEAGGDCLTYFEFLTVLAARIFADAEVDVAIFEAGLGGTHDATTILEKDFLCVTPVELDHEAVLGYTPEAVARDKAGAMRPGVPVFSAPQAASVEAVLRGCAGRCGASFEVAQPVQVSQVLGLTGPHQRINAGLAKVAWIAAARQHGWHANARLIDQALADAWLPGRLQQIPAAPEHPPLIVDGAHNAHGLRALRSALATLPCDPQSLIFACMGDKALNAILPLVRDIAGDKPVLVPPVKNCARAMNPEELARMLGGNARPAPSLEAALKALPREEPALLCGSLYLTGEFFTLWPEYLNAAPQPCSNF